MSAAVPIVDFQQYGLHLTNPKSVNSSLLEKTAKDLYHAFSSTGVCYIINHGVSQSMLMDGLGGVSLSDRDEEEVSWDSKKTEFGFYVSAFEATQVDEVFKLSKSFFSLPVGEKQKYARGNGITYQSGWVCTGREHLDTNTGLGDIKESFDVIPVNVKWPTTIPEFQSTYLRFFDTCKQLTERVLDVLSIGLKLEDRNFLRSCHRLIGQIGNQTAMRSLYYPEVPTDGSVKPGQVRCGEHSDYGTVTLLFQDDVGGLEVHNTDGEYVPATPIPGAVVVNIGDLMQQWTSDKLIATKHRVLIPEEELKKKQCRQSIAFFINPDDDTIIKCLNGSDKYKPVSSYDYLSNKITASY